MLHVMQRLLRALSPLYRILPLALLVGANSACALMANIERQLSAQQRHNTMLEQQREAAVRAHHKAVQDALAKMTPEQRLEFIQRQQIIEQQQRLIDIQSWHGAAQMLNAVNNGAMMMRPQQPTDVNVRVKTNCYTYGGQTTCQ